MLLTLERFASHVHRQVTKRSRLLRQSVEDIGLFGGLCGLTPRRRRQASGDATRAGPVFPTKGEAATEGTPPARHGGWGTRATRRGSHRNSRRNSRDPRVATVYTSAPERLREAILADLCTLLRSHACPQRRNSVHEWHKTTLRGHFRRSVYTLSLPTTARATGRGHGSHDVDGPMAP